MKNPLVRLGIVAVFGCCLAPPAHAAEDWETALDEGKLAQAEQILVKKLEAGPKDDNARLALGAVRFLKAVETRGRFLYRHGLRLGDSGLASSLPIPRNPKPEKLDAKGLHAALTAWVDDLALVDRTLAEIASNDVKLPIRLGSIRLDLDGDGSATEKERLWSIYVRLNREADKAEDNGRDLVVAFDRADVDWLRGYCHLLSALAELWLAHDFTDLFNHSGHFLFEGAPPPADFLVERREKPGNFDIQEIFDFAAAIHLARFPVAEPDRMKSVHARLEKVAALSRSSWKFILAETDDDREWVPSPKQRAVGTNVRVTDEVVAGWHVFLDEFEAILAGEKLLPFWRGNDPKRGVNLRRVFLEPRPFDLVLWVEGSAAAPYLEKGTVTSPDTWSRINRMCRGEFIGFAVWFN